MNVVDDVDNFVLMYVGEFWYIVSNVFVESIFWIFLEFFCEVVGYDCNEMVFFEICLFEVMIGD